MSRRVLDLHLDARWDDVADAIKKELDTRRGGHSLEIFVERRMARGAFGIEIDVEPPDEGPMPCGAVAVDEVTGTRWTRNVVPMSRFRTSVITIERRSLEGADEPQIQRWATTLVDSAIYIEHSAILHGAGPSESRLVSEARVDPFEKDSTDSKAGSADQANPRSWVVIGPEGHLPAAGNQFVITPTAAPTTKLAYMARFTGSKPVVMHEAKPWHLVRLADQGESVCLCLEADWVTEIPGSDGFEVQVIGLNDEPMVAEIRACESQIDASRAERDRGLTPRRARIEMKRLKRASAPLKAWRVEARRRSTDRLPFEEPALDALARWATQVRREAKKLRRSLAKQAASND